MYVEIGSASRVSGQGAATSLSRRCPWQALYDIIIDLHLQALLRTDVRRSEVEPSSDLEVPHCNRCINVPPYPGP